MKYKFGVITKVPDPKTDDGNMATFIDLYLVKEMANKENDYREQLTKVVDANPGALLTMRAPVFHVGEILILNLDGREVGYPGRKPSKWNVTCETFDDLDAAVQRALVVMEELEVTE